MDFDGFDASMLVVFGFPLLVVALAMAYAAYQRHLQHKERMAMIEKGIAPPVSAREDGWGSYRGGGTRSGVTTTLVGVAITLGLLTIGKGPWLIGGLVPTAVGCAMIIQQLADDKKRKRGDDE